MPEGEISTEPQVALLKPARISRRTFFKAIPLLIAGAISPETDKPNNDLLSIETPEARYFPMGLA